MQAALIALATAVFLDITFGDPPNRFHPVVAMGGCIRGLTRRWNTGSSRSRFWGGCGVIAVGLALFSAPWLLFVAGSAELPYWLTGILTGIALKPVFSFRGLLLAGRDVHQRLAAADLDGARRLVAWHLVSRDAGGLSAGQVASATVESLAENLTDSFVAPLFFFSLGGLPLAWAYRYINTADAMIAYHTPKFEYFGKAAAVLDDIINWLPARLAALFLVASAGLCRLNMKKSFVAMLRQHARTESPNAGWTMAAAAGALGVTLEKAGQYKLGDGDLPLDGDIVHAIRLVSVALVISLIFCGGIVVGLGQWF